MLIFMLSTNIVLKLPKNNKNFINFYFLKAVASGGVQGGNCPLPKGFRKIKKEKGFNGNKVLRIYHRKT